MDPRPFLPYVALWVLATLIAVGLAWRRRGSLVLFSREYRRYLSAPWKLVTFGVALAAFVLLAPYTGDPTWDAVDATLMSVLCFWTAPWVVGHLYRAARGGARAADTYVAVIAWLFTASWVYDGYLLLRDGQYPTTWLVNIGASSVIYALAGLFWNVAVVPGRGLVFGFMVAEWPDVEERGGAWQRALLLAAIMLPVAAGTLWYVWDYVFVAGNAVGTP